MRQQLLRMQAEAAGLPLIEIPLPWPCSNQQYETIMGEALESARNQLQMDAVAFGDLYLEDIRNYREAKMQGTGLELLFPLWQIPTAELAQQMIAGGLKAAITCLDPRVMPAAFCRQISFPINCSKSYQSPSTPAEKMESSIPLHGTDLCLNTQFQ